MKSVTSKYLESFLVLENTVENFIKEVNNQKLSNWATDDWVVKDVLCHITFWHRYYAKQYADLAVGKKPFVFTSKGGSKRNQEGVKSLRNESKGKLLKNLVSSNKSLYKSIVIKEVSGMDYTDKKHYKTEDFLGVVIGHIKRHTIQIKRAKEVPDKILR